MSFPAALFPWWGLLLLDLAVLLVLGALVRRIAWRRITAVQVNAWLGACVLVMVLWALRDDYLPGLSYHLLGMTVLGLMMGPALALLAAALVIAAAILGSGGDGLSLGLVWCCSALLPIGAGWLALRLTQRWLPANYFVYLFLNAFLAGALAMALAGLANVLVLGLVSAYPWSMLFDQALPYYLLLAWSEAFTTGLMMAILIVYRPQWVATFDDARYLNDRFQEIDMPFALWSILIAAVLPLVWAVVAKAGAPYDNSRPREVLAQASGHRQRANWAQQNAWEAFAPYAAAVLVAFIMKVPSARLDAMALIFLLARLGHGLCYVRNLPTARSLCWLVGFACVLVLFVLAGLA